MRSLTDPAEIDSGIITQYADSASITVVGDMRSDPLTQDRPVERYLVTPVQRVEDKVYKFEFGNGWTD